MPLTLAVARESADGENRPPSHQDSQEIHGARCPVRSKHRHQQSLRPDYADYIVEFRPASAKPTPAPTILRVTPPTLVRNRWRCRKVRY